MKLLLDTHVLIWALEGSYRLPQHICEMIIDANNEIYVSAASLWEISIKHKKHPEQMTFSANQIRDFAQRAGYIFLSLNLDAISVYDANDLTMHNDPFDQILVCQSQAHGMRLLTHDKKLKSFGLGYIELF